jgi:hypothetical protein
VHVGHVEARDLARRLEQRHGGIGVVGVDVHAQRSVVAHHEHGVTEILEQGCKAAGVEALSGDREVRAEAEARRLVLGPVEGGGRVVMLELGRRVAAERGEAAGHHHGEPVCARIDHSGLTQDRQLLGASVDGLLGRLECVLEHLGEQLVLLRGGGVRTEARAVHVSQVVSHPAGHRAHRGQHRALGGVAHGRVGGVGRARERGGHQDRVDQLARAGGQLLRSAPHDLRQDHAAVAARAEQRRAGDGADDLVSPDRVDGLSVHRVERLQHRLERERHVVPRVAVGNGEDVQVVHLLAAGFQLRERSGDDPPEADQALVGHVQGSTPATGRVSRAGGDAGRRERS